MILSPSYTFTILAPVELRFTPIYQIGDASAGFLVAP